MRGFLIAWMALIGIGFANAQQPMVPNTPPLATNNLVFGPFSSVPFLTNTMASKAGSINLYNPLLTSWGSNAVVLCIQGNRPYLTGCPIMGTFGTPNAAAAYTAADQVGFVADVNTTAAWLQNVAGTFTSTVFTPSSPLNASQIANLLQGQVVDTDDTPICSGIVTSWAANGTSITTMGFYAQGTLTACSPPAGTHGTIRSTKIFGGNVVVNMIAGASQQTSATGIEFDCNNGLGQDFGPTLNGGRLNCIDLVNLGANQASEAARIRGKFFTGIDMSGLTPQGAAIVFPVQTPASSASPCTRGGFYMDGTYLYTCISSGVWSRNTLWNWPSINVSALPTCAAGNEGQWASVNDALVPTYNATVTGGGAVKIPVYCNGSNWTAH